MKNRSVKNLINTFAKVAFALVVTVVLFFADATAQVQTLNPVYTKVSTYIKGYYESLPVNYQAQASKKFPLIIFIHGKGEVGDGSATALPKVANTGIARLIKQGKFPASFTVNGEAHSFIVVAPQITTNAYAQAPAFMAELLAYCKKTYRVDESRIYITGLSMGGGMTWKAVGAHAADFAAAVPICGSVTATSAEAKMIADNKLPVWATHNDGDPTISVNVTKGWNTRLVAAHTTPAPKMTIFVAKSHDAWSKTYDPAFKENGLNIYEWMLSNKKGGTAAAPAAPVVVAQPPVANAGADLIVTLPVSTITLNGGRSAAYSGSIVAYSWSKIAGPAQGMIASAAAATSSVSGLVEGSYSFLLKVTDSNNLTATDTVLVTVKPEPVVVTPPVANAGADQAITLPVNSITLDGSSSSAPNDNIVSYKWTKTFGAAATITNAAAAQTTVTGLEQGNYTFTLTVTNSKQMSTSTSVNVIVAGVAGTPISVAGVNQTIALPANSVTVNGSASKATAGRIISYTWTKVSGGAATITNNGSAITSITGLSAGVYEFSLKVTADNGKRSTSIVTITVNGAAASARTAAAEGVTYENKAAINALTVTAATEIAVYPNPVVSDLNVKISSQAIGQTHIVIYDLSGKMLMQQQFNKADAATLYKSFNLSKLPAGFYLVKVLIGNEVNEISKIVKK